MAITIDDFSKIWASTSPLTPYSFSESNYKEGWNFIGQIPPSRQMWDFLQKNNDEKMQYLANNYLPLSGGTMTGNISMGNGKTIHFIDSNNPPTAGSGGWIGAVGSGLRVSAENYGLSASGARIELRGRNYAIDAGRFDIIAANTNNEKVLTGKPDGTLTWDGKSIPQRSYGVNLGANATHHTFDIAENGAVIFAKRGNNASCHMVTVWDATSTQFFVSGTDPITVSVSVDAKTATITNVNASAVAVKIINGGAL